MLTAAGFHYRLSDEVFHYDSNLEASLCASSDASISIPVKIVDNAVDQRLLDKAEYIFRENGPFWNEHDYSVLSNASRKVGYFSYMYPMKERSASNVIEQLIDAIFLQVAEQFPDISEECNFGKSGVRYS